MARLCQRTEKYVQVLFSSLVLSLGHQAEMLVTSLCCILLWLCLPPRPSSRRMKKREKDNGGEGLSRPLGCIAPPIRERFSSLRVLAPASPLQDSALSMSIRSSLPLSRERLERASPGALSFGGPSGHFQVWGCPAFKSRDTGEVTR